MKISASITYQGIDLEVKGEFEEGSPASWDYEEVPTTFYASFIGLSGQDIKGILSEEVINEIEILTAKEYGK